MISTPANLPHLLPLLPLNVRMTFHLQSISSGSSPSPLSGQTTQKQSTIWLCIQRSSPPLSPRQINIRPPSPNSLKCLLSQTSTSLSNHSWPATSIPHSPPTLCILFHLLIASSVAHSSQIPNWVLSVLHLSRHLRRPLSLTHPLHLNQASPLRQSIPLRHSTPVRQSLPVRRSLPLRLRQALQLIQPLRLQLLHTLTASTLLSPSLRTATLCSSPRLPYPISYTPHTSSLYHTVLLHFILISPIHPLCLHPHPPPTLYPATPTPPVLLTMSLPNQIPWNPTRRKQSRC